MRASTISTLLGGAMLALGACSTTDTGGMTLAERTEQCRGMIRAEIAPTGRQTGDARNDYACRSVNARDRHDYGDRNITGDASARSAATDRALRNGG